MDDLVTWLRAQLDDDERVAHEAGATGPDGFDLFVIDDDHRHNTIAIPAARVLGEVDAKRRMVDWARQMYDWAADNNLWGYDETAILKLLALPYADRPGYRDEWRPS